MSIGVELELSNGNLGCCLLCGKFNEVVKIKSQCSGSPWVNNLLPHAHKLATWLPNEGITFEAYLTQNCRLPLMGKGKRNLQQRC